MILALSDSPRLIGFFIFALIIGLLTIITLLVLRGESLRIMDGLKERFGEGDDRNRYFYSYKEQLLATAEPVDGGAFRVFLGDDDVIMAYSQNELTEIIGEYVMYSPFVVWRHMWLSTPGTQVSK